MSYGTEYIDIPLIKPEKNRVGKDSKMSKNQSTNEASKAKSYRKTRGEHVKDILIAVLITAVIGFVAGVHFSNKQHAQVERAVSQAQAVQTQATVKK